LRRAPFPLVARDGRLVAHPSVLAPSARLRANRPSLSPPLSCQRKAETAHAVGRRSFRLYPLLSREQSAKRAKNADHLGYAARLYLFPEPSQRLFLALCAWKCPLQSAPMSHLPLLRRRPQDARKRRKRGAVGALANHAVLQVCQAKVRRF
jgi:hypothetical protein